MKSTEQMEDAKSIIVLGYHASDDIYEAILGKANGIEAYYPLLMSNAQRRLLLYLQAKGFEAKAANE